MSIVPIRIMPLLFIFDVTFESYLGKEKEYRTEDVTHPKVFRLNLLKPRHI